MRPNRRRFLAAAAVTGTSAGLPGRLQAADDQPVTYAELDAAAEQTVLNVDELTQPVIIRSMELLRNGREYMVRVRTGDGAEGLAVANGSRLAQTYPVFLQRVAPFFVGKDARHLEPLLWQLYRHGSNYKFQGLALWVCVAAAEFAILELLGQLTGRSVGELLGGVQRREIAVYRASGNRGNTPEEEVEYLRELVGESGARALKFRLGGRMSRNADSLPRRSEQLVRLAREAFGPDMTLYADANSSYDPEHAIRIGRMMEEYDYGFFEEPCPFDHLEETKEVADALSMPVAGGEQEFSHWRFRWQIYHRAVDIVQPDLHYYGGFIRSMRVARMADRAGLVCAPHMSGSGLGYLDVAHFVSCIPNPNPFHEFKGNAAIPARSASSSLRCEKGIVQVPSGPGFGITLDEEFVRQAELVRE